MRYELDSSGYISKVFFGCTSGNCAAYSGTVPSGYPSLQRWADTANIRAYKIVNGNLTYYSARDNELKALWNTEAEESKKDNYISSKGNNSNGHWIKYADGTMICYQRYKLTFAAAEEWGSMYAYSITNIKNYPATFNELPAVSATLSARGKNGWLCTNVETGTESTSRPCGYQVVRPTKTTLEDMWLQVIAVGRWK